MRAGPRSRREARSAHRMAHAGAGLPRQPDRRGNGGTRRIVADCGRDRREVPVACNLREAFPFGALPLLRQFIRSKLNFCKTK